MGFGGNFVLRLVRKSHIITCTLGGVKLPREKRSPREPPAYFGLFGGPPSLFSTLELITDPIGSKVRKVSLVAYTWHVTF